MLDTGKLVRSARSEFVDLLQVANQMIPVRVLWFASARAHLSAIIKD